MDLQRIRQLTLAAAILGSSLVLGLVPSSRAAGGGEPLLRVGPIGLHPAPPGARALITWAVTRYEGVGLGLPPVEVAFHSGDDGCGGYLGTTVAGRIDLCVRLAMEPGPQRIVLHEMAHAWVDVNIDPAEQASFLSLRGLDRWADRADPWRQRGNEQAAEIIAWGLGDGSMLPKIDGLTEPRALSDAFRMLTGVAPISPSD